MYTLVQELLMRLCLSVSVWLLIYTLCYLNQCVIVDYYSALLNYDYWYVEFNNKEAHEWLTNPLSSRVIGGEEAHKERNPLIKSNSYHIKDIKESFTKYTCQNPSRSASTECMFMDALLYLNTQHITQTNQQIIIHVYNSLFIGVMILLQLNGMITPGLIQTNTKKITYVMVNTVVLSVLLGPNTVIWLNMLYAELNLESIDSEVSVSIK